LTYKSDFVRVGNLLFSGGLMKRRSFLGLLSTVFGLTAAGSFAYPLIRYLAPPRYKIEIGSKAFKKKEVGDAKEVVFQNTPSIIINRPGKGYIALSRVCTHLGCLLEFDKANNRLVCPCHAGVFDLEGRVKSGPPPKPLKTFPIKVEGENIIIG
jgi:cytochrome b6-f complex iron-sulfur subunit